MIDFGRQSMRTLALRLLGAVVVLLHGELLWRRLADGSFAQAGVAARWLASVALIAGLVIAYRRNGRLFRSRQAVVLWTLVALLHALSGVPGAAMVAEPAPWLIVPLAVMVARALAVALRSPAAPKPWTSLRGPRGSTGLTLCAAHAGAVGSRAPPR